MIREQYSKETPRSHTETGAETYNSTRKQYSFLIKNNQCYLDEVLIRDQNGTKIIKTENCRKLKDFLKKANRNLGGCSKEITSNTQKRKLNKILEEGNVNIEKRVRS